MESDREHADVTDEMGDYRSGTQTDGQIIPMAIRYDRKNKKCQVKFSPPLYGEQLADYRNGIQELRDVMAALRWEIMEEYSEVTKRKNIHLSDFDKEKEEIIREYPLLDWQYEESVIYKK